MLLQILKIKYFLLVIAFVIIGCTSKEQEVILKPERIAEGWQYTVVGRDDTLIVHISPLYEIDSITIK